MADSVVKNANKEQYEENAIFDRLLDETLEPDVDDITYEAPTELPMESEGIRSIGLEMGGNAGIETLKQTTIQLQEMPPDRNMTVLQRMMKQAGAPAQDPKLLAQVSQVLGRDV